MEFHQQGDFPRKFSCFGFWVTNQNIMNGETEYVNYKSGHLSGL